MLAHLPTSFPHGTRASYTHGCRCDACKASNRAYYHDRQRRAREEIAKLPPAAPGPVRQLIGAPARQRQAKQLCPGLGGFPCTSFSGIKANSIGGVCAKCRERLVWNGMVKAEPTRRRLQWMSSDWGLGYKTVADAAGVAPSVVAKILSGQRKKIRKSTADRILAVTPEARADHAVISGVQTWEDIRFMLARGLTRGEIAQRLGNKRPALQLRQRVLAVTAWKVAKLREQVEAETAARVVRPGKYCAVCETKHTPAERRALVARMLPAPRAEIEACWPCMYAGYRGKEYLTEDLIAIEKGIA